MSGFFTEGVWRSMMSETTVLGNVTKGLIFNDTDPFDIFVFVPSGGRYLVAVQTVFARGAGGGGQRYLYLGVGENGADPEVFLASANSDSTDYITAGGTYMLDIEGDRELRLMVMQIRDGAADSMTAINFVSMALTIVSI